MKAITYMLAGALAIFAGTDLWAVPAGFNVQGRLTDADGINKDGTFQIKFSVFAGDAGGFPVWEKNMPSVPVKNGNFQVVLQGQGDNFAQLESAINNLETAYVEIKVGSEPPLVPRQPLLRSPFSPVENLAGAVMFFAGGACPDGWLLLNGSTLPVSGAYAALFARINYLYGGSGGNFVLPNMADGTFIRGTGGNAAASGVKQADAFQGHFHKVLRRDDYEPSGWGFADPRWAAGSSYNAVTHGAGTPGADLVAKTIESDGPNGTPRTASETRPQNYAMIPCIKY